jgi:endogenous inhibitor of DNA gyrase (YacG/DUF329 family)
MSDPSKTKPKAACPLCGKPAMHRFAPFCSGRCADLDLGRWLKGGYVIPAGVEEAEAPGTESGDLDSGEIGAGQDPGQVPGRAGK